MALDSANKPHIYSDVDNCVIVDAITKKSVALDIEQAMPDALNEIIQLIEREDSVQNPSGKMEDSDLAELYSFADLILPFMENGFAEVVLNQEETDFED